MRMVPGMSFVLRGTRILLLILVMTYTIILGLNENGKSYGHSSDDTGRLKKHYKSIDRGVGEERKRERERDKEKKNTNSEHSCCALQCTAITFKYLGVFW